MTVQSLGEYAFPSADAPERFKGKQLLYIWWERHRMFSRPFVVALPPDTPFSEIVGTHITDCYQVHPDFAHIDWSRVEWRNGTESFTPDLGKSLADNGIGHKDLIRMITPGLDGIAGSGY